MTVSRKKINYLKPDGLYSDVDISAAVTALAPLRDALSAALSDATYATPYASVRVPYDDDLQHVVHKRVQEIGPIDLCVVIGIGGSSLGFRAVYDALQDQASIAPHNVLVLETVDTPFVNNALSRIEQALTQKLRVHVSLISKSGTTTETIGLWHVVQSVLQKYNPQRWQTQVTIITDANSALEQYAKAHDIAVLNIPRLVGGRYSVLSAVGLFPLMLCGIDTEQLHAGARDALTDAISMSLKDTVPFQHALSIFTAYQNGYAVHDTFIFSVWCATLGLWYRQLAAESLGKATADGSVVDIIPTVSLGSTDLHSIGQLYLSGAQNFWTTFLIVHESNDIKTNADKSLDACVASLNNRSLSDIMDAITRGTLQAYRERGVPFSVVTLAERSPYTLGYLMQSYMLAIMYAGTLLAVDPFNQPDVERYKIITRKLLS